MKQLYVLQPYHVGSKHAKSLALVIPAKIVKEYNVDQSTVFALNVNDKTKKIILQTVNEIIQKVTAESLVASSQQTPDRVQ
jgi:antitoxin component of MazEF toxin-antitoxin module